MSYIEFKNISKIYKMGEILSEKIVTLRVLGFFDKEVDNYITKENIILMLVKNIWEFIQKLFMICF